MRDDVPWEQIERVLMLNAVAPLAFARSCWLDAQSGQRRDRDDVVARSQVGLFYNAAYSACKETVSQWTSAIRAEMQDTGIRVAVVCPTSVSDVGVTRERLCAFPRRLGRSPRDVAEAVYRAATGEGPFERVVARLPFRPLLALCELWPELGVRLVNRLGIAAMYEALAAAANARVSPPR